MNCLQKTPLKHKSMLCTPKTYAFKRIRTVRVYNTKHFQQNDDGKIDSEFNLRNNQIQ